MHTVSALVYSLGNSTNFCSKSSSRSTIESTGDSFSRAWRNTAEAGWIGFRPRRLQVLQPFSRRGAEEDG